MYNILLYIWAYHCAQVLTLQITDLRVHMHTAVGEFTSGKTAKYTHTAS